MSTLTTKRKMKPSINSHIREKDRLLNIEHLEPPEADKPALPLATEVDPWRLGR